MSCPNCHDNQLEIKSLLIDEPQIWYSSSGQSAKVIISFSENEKQGSLERATAILVDEAARILGNNGLFAGNE